MQIISVDAFVHSTKLEDSQNRPVKKAKTIIMTEVKGAGINSGGVNFDEDAKNDVMNLMSRTLAVYGTDVMAKLLKLRVLVVGLRGVGLETAKNLILAGPGSVTLFDNGLIEIADLGCNFYASPSDVGKKRSVVCRTALAQLNPYVEVQAHTGELNESFISNFHCVVFTDETPRADLLRFNTFCHNHTTRHINPATQQPENVPSPIAFLLAQTNGVVSHVFVDFGPSHLVNDPDGLPSKVFPSCFMSVFLWFVFVFSPSVLVFMV